MSTKSTSSDVANPPVNGSKSPTSSEPVATEATAEATPADATPEVATAEATPEVATAEATSPAITESIPETTVVELSSMTRMTHPTASFQSNPLEFQVTRCCHSGVEFRFAATPDGADQGPGSLSPVLRPTSS
ncbi:hypothetical protein L6452_35978 [Arctium lappa]|uniref:Uncharacterized protein n=1 Tax=Arctium lappa TaxID=4217 RepID=A0ACB8Y9C9_ARCLA|nr:hypothetical protein L6452_35978 [Arctium lappa]